MRVACKRHGVSLLGSAANAQHCTRVGLGKPAEAPTQTVERVEKALATLQSIERFACTLAEAAHRLQGYKCCVWAPGFEQFEDQELPLVIWKQCAKVPRERLGISLLGSAANVQHLGQPAEAPTETVERLGKALKTLQSTERFACDQHDHVSFVKAWMLLSRGVEHALDCDFRLVPPLVMVPLQRRLENGQRQTMSALLEGDELAWERAKVPTCYGGLGTQATPLGFAARATYWSAFDLHKAVMPSICDALNRPIREVHPEATDALAAKADLLVIGVAVDEYA